MGENIRIYIFILSRMVGLLCVLFLDFNPPCRSFNYEQQHIMNHLSVDVHTVLFLYAELKKKKKKYL